MPNPNRLYKYRITELPRYVDMEAWRAHAEEAWGDPGKEFFLPDEGKVFRSRSSARERVEIVRRWGGDAEVLECEPQWIEVGEAARRRKASRDKQRADALRRKADLIQYGSVPF